VPLQLQPFASNALEGVRLGKTLGLLSRTWINSIREQPPRFFTPFASFGEGSVRICANREELFPSGDAVFEPPESPARGFTSK
jgi:hypothetical protein